MSERKRRRIGISLILDYAVSFWKNYDNIVVTGQCCHLLLEAIHNGIPLDISFCAGYVVILQNEQESCLRHAWIFLPFSWKGIKAKQCSTKASPCCWSAKAVKLRLTNAFRSLIPIEINRNWVLKGTWKCEWLLARLHNNVIGRNHGWDGIKQHVLGSTSILMLVLPIVWTVLVSPWTTISDEIADSLFFVTVKLSFPLTVAHSKDSLVSVCHISLFWFLHDVCYLSLFSLKR